MVWVSSELDKFFPEKAGQIIKADHEKSEFHVKVQPGWENTPPELKITRGDGYSLAPMMMPPMGVDDMMTLSDLHVGALLHNLKMRFNNHTIYTYIGQILVVVNPFEDLNLTGITHKKKYCGSALSEVPPHIFGIANQAWESMLRGGNQSVIVSGESGAGKSESTKHVLEFLAYRSSVEAGRETEIANQVVDTSLILEAFGNACTTRNNNSSRFGKFVEVQFDDHGVIQGARVEQYLLEKSRVVNPGKDERNYHVFYNIFHYDGAREWGLTRPEDFRYAYAGKKVLADGIDDVKCLAVLRHCMTSLGFSEDLQRDLFACMAAILHLGQIQFVKKTGARDDVAAVRDPAPLKRVCSLMGFAEAELEYALVTREIKLPGKDDHGRDLPPICKPLTVQQAIDNTDAFAKGIYAAVFQWIVEHITETTGREGDFKWIGCLDIFGFEHFKVVLPDKTERANNSFEQLCINYANEKLQNFFNDYIFEQEKEIYRREGLWGDGQMVPIEYDRNDPCLQLINEQLGILDELTLSNRDGITNVTFLEKMRGKWDTTPGKCEDFSKRDKRTGRPAGGFQKKEEHRKLASQYFGAVRMNDHGTDLTDFYVSHYAGEVQYSVCKLDEHDRPDTTSIGFIEKNRDTMMALCIPVLESSRYAFVRDMFSPGRRAATRTVASVFRASLNKLVNDKLMKTHPWFIRCVKPNVAKVPVKFENDLVLAQLRAAGMLETINARNAGFPQRLTPDDFLDRYGPLRVLVPDIDRSAPYMEQCGAVLDWIFQERPQYKLVNPCWLPGSTLVFMKDGMTRALEAELGLALRETAKARAAAAAELKCVVRMYLANQMSARLKEDYARNKKRLDRKRELMKGGMTADEAERQIDREEEEARLAVIEKERVAIVGDIEAGLPRAQDGIATYVGQLDEVAAKTPDEAQRQDCTARRKALQEAGHAVEDRMRALQGDGWRDGEKVKAARDAVRHLQDLNDRERVDAAREKGKMEDIIRRETQRREDEERRAREERERLEREERERQEEEERRQRLEREDRERKELEAMLRKEKEEYERLLRAEKEEQERHERAEKAELERQQREAEEKKRIAEQRLRAEKTAAVKTAMDRIQLQLNKAKHEQEQLEKERQRLLSERRAREKELKRQQEAEETEERQKHELVDKRDRVVRRHAARKAKREEEREAAKSTVLEGTRILWKGRRGTVRYRGRLPIPGVPDDIWLGLELDKPIEKKGNDGSCLGVQYFFCEPDHGMFVRDDTVQIVREDDAKKVGAHVVVHGKRGIIRYVGTVKMEEGSYVGVELEEQGAGKNDGVVHGHRYFTCPPKTGVFTSPDNVDIVQPWSEEYVHDKLLEYCIEHGLVTEEDRPAISALSAKIRL